MKKILVFGLMVLAQWCFGQTVEIETALLNRGIEENRWSQEGMMERGRKWAKVKGNYPVMQYDSLSGEVILDELITFPGITKSQAFKRMKEWASINFSNVDDVIEYEDMESGKLFFKGYVEITHLIQVRFLWARDTYPTRSNLYFTLSLTIKDEKAKVRFENLRFISHRAGFATSTYYVPAESIETSLRSYLPVAWSSPNTWEDTFDLLRNSMTSLRRFPLSMQRYIRAINEDYKF